MLYFAYGSNLDYTRLFGRCSSAEVFSKAELRGYKLVFMENNTGRIVANLIKSKGDIVPGVLFDLTKKDFKELDRYEGYPYVYGKVDIKAEVRGNDVKAVTYIMEEEFLAYDRVTKGWRSHTRGYGVPKQEYFDYLVRGYNMFNLPQSYLMNMYIFSKNKRNLEINEE